LRLLLDEMYSGALARALRDVGVEARTASDLGLGGRSDPDVFAAAAADGLKVLTENVADFVRIASEHVASGGHHHGVLVALSTRFSRRPAGVGVLVAAIMAAAAEPVEDRIIYLSRD